MLINSIFLPKPSNEQPNSEIKLDNESISFSYLFSDLFSTVEAKVEKDEQKDGLGISTINEDAIFYNNPLIITSSADIKLIDKSSNILNKLSDFIFNSTITTDQNSEIKDADLSKLNKKYFVFNKKEFLSELKSLINALSKSLDQDNKKVQITIVSGNSNLSIDQASNSVGAEQWLLEQLKTNNDFELIVKINYNKTNDDNLAIVNNETINLLELINKNQQINSVKENKNTKSDQNKEAIIFSNPTFLNADPTDIEFYSDSGTSLSQSITINGEENVKLKNNDTNFMGSLTPKFKNNMATESAQIYITNEGKNILVNNLSEGVTIESINNNKIDSNVLEDETKVVNNNFDIGGTNNVEAELKSLQLDNSDQTSGKIITASKLSFKNAFPNAFPNDSMSISLVKIASSKKQDLIFGKQTELNNNRQQILSSLMESNNQSTDKSFDNETKNIVVAAKSANDKNLNNNEYTNQNFINENQKSYEKVKIDLMQKRVFTSIPKIEISSEENFNKKLQKVDSDRNIEEESVIDSGKNFFPDDLKFNNDRTKQVWVKLLLGSTNDENNLSLDNASVFQNKTITLDTKNERQENAQDINNIYQELKLTSKNVIKENLTEQNSSNPLFQKINEHHNNISNDATIQNQKPLAFVNDNSSKSLMQQNSFVTAQRTSEFIEKAKLVSSKDLLNEVYKVFEEGNKHSVVLKIEPKELGTIKIMIDTVDNVLNAKVDVQNETVGNLIRNNLDQLKQNLLQSGIHVNSINISYNNSDHKQNSFSNQKRKNAAYSRISKNENETSDFSAKQMGYNTYEYLI